MVQVVNYIKAYCKACLHDSNRFIICLIVLLAMYEGGPIYALKAVGIFLIIMWIAWELVKWAKREGKL